MSSVSGSDRGKEVQGLLSGHQVQLLSWGGEATEAEVEKADRRGLCFIYAREPLILK